LKYSIYWSIAETPSHTIKAYTVFLVIAVISIFAWALIKKYKASNGDYEKSILLWSVGFISVFSSVAFYLQKFVFIDKSDDEIMQIINSPKAQIVEGTISNFHRQVEQKRYADETIESFQVDSVTFNYSSAAFGKFNSFAKTNNGVLNNGLPIRITYLKDTGVYMRNHIEILKIEIGDE
jgi:hypothetical protein